MGACGRLMIAEQIVTRCQQCVTVCSSSVAAQRAVAKACCNPARRGLVPQVGSRGPKSGPGDASLVFGTPDTCCLAATILVRNKAWPEPFEKYRGDALDCHRNVIKHAARKTGSVRAQERTRGGMEARLHRSGLSSPLADRSWHDRRARPRTALHSADLRYLLGHG